MSEQTIARQTVVITPARGEDEPEDGERPDPSEKKRRRRIGPRRARSNANTSTDDEFEAQGLTPEGDEQKKDGDESSKSKNKRFKRGLRRGHSEADTVGDSTESPKDDGKSTAFAPDWVIAGRPTGHGPRLLLWLAYVRLCLFKFTWIPQPRPYGVYAMDNLRIKARLVPLRHASMAIIAVFTTKGGATKTTIATWLSAVKAWITNLVVLIFDTDGGRGKVAKRFGIDPNDTLASSAAVEEINDEAWLPTYEDLVARVQTDAETGVLMFHCPAGANLEEGPLVKTLYELKTCGHSLVVDCGPGFGVAATRGAVRASTVRVITADHNSTDDLDDVAATLDYDQYKLRDHLDSVVVAISAVKWRKYNTRTQYELAELFGVKPEQVVLIPYVHYLLKTKRVSIPMLNVKALHAFCRLEEAVTKAAVAFNKKHAEELAKTLEGSGVKSDDVPPKNTSTGTVPVEDVSTMDVVLEETPSIPADDSVTDQTEEV